MDLEMANMRVKSDKIEVLNVQLTHGLPIDRTKRLSLDQYEVKESKLLGANLKTYKVKGEANPGVLENLFTNYKPYNLCVTVMMHSPMKLFVYN